MSSGRFLALDCTDVTFKEYSDDIKRKTTKNYNLYKQKCADRKPSFAVLERDCVALIEKSMEVEADWKYYNYFFLVSIITEILIRHTGCKEDAKRLWTKRANTIFEHLESKINLNAIYESEIRRIKEAEKKQEEDRKAEQQKYLQLIPRAECEARSRLTDEALSALKDILRSAAEQRPLDEISVSELDMMQISQPGSQLGDLFSPVASNAVPSQPAAGAEKLFSPEPQTKPGGLSSLFSDGSNPTPAQAPAPRQVAPTHADGLSKLMFVDPCAQTTNAAREEEMRNKILGINKTADHASTQHDQVRSILSAQDEEAKRKEELRKEREEQQRKQQLQQQEDAKKQLLEQQQAAHQQQLLQQQQQKLILEKQQAEEQKARELALQEQQLAAELEAMKRKIAEDDKNKLAAQQELMARELNILKEQDATINQIMNHAQPYIDSANVLLLQCNNALQTRMWNNVELFKPMGAELGKRVEETLRACATQLFAFPSQTPAWQVAAASLSKGIQQITNAKEIVQAVKEISMQQQEGMSDRSQINNMRKQLPYSMPITPGTSEHQYAIILKGELQKLKNRQADRHRQQMACNWRFPPPGRSTQPRRGFVNLGNTCYMNSILQSLLVTPLAEPFKNGSILSDINLINPLGSTGRVANTFYDVVQDMQTAVSYPISPSLFKSAIGRQNETFEGQRQQDANEFLQTLLSSLHEDFNRSRGKESNAVPELTSEGKNDLQVAAESASAYQLNNNSLITNIFGFLERSTVSCPLCKHRSVSFTVQQSLLLPIDQSRDDCTLIDCLYRYTDQERLPEGSEWLCPNCKGKSRAEKQLSLWSHPKILVLALNRFCTYGNLADKIRAPVKFPEVLDLSSYVVSTSTDTKVLYELTSIVNHDGGMGGGHYTCDVKGSQDGQWHHFSDERHHPVSGSPNFSQAYILFYKLKTP